TSQFGISPSTDNLGQAITNAIKAASEVSQGLVIDTPGEYVITGKVTTNGRISAENLNGFKLVIGDGVRITSLFDIGGVDHVVHLFEFINCNDVTICGGGEVDVLVADNPPASRVTFSVFYFNNLSNIGPNDIRLKGPLKVRLRGVPGFSYNANYAGHV